MSDDRLTWNLDTAAKHLANAMWRGPVAFKQLRRHRWRVLQPVEDPCRLYVGATGLEYAFGNDWESDGPSIPNLVCALFFENREKYLKAGFLHDFGFKDGFLYVRNPDTGEDWRPLKVSKRDMDNLYCIGAARLGASRTFTWVMQRGLSGRASKIVWKRYRRMDGDPDEPSRELVEKHGFGPVEKA